MNEKERDEVEGDIDTIEKLILPDLRERLAYLTDPNYDPTANADDEYREQDIEEIEAKIAKEERHLCYLEAKLARHLKAELERERLNHTSSQNANTATAN